MNRKRLARLAHAIEHHHKKKLGFNMRAFYSPEKEIWRSPLAHKDRYRNTDCGAVACIAGHAVAYFQSVRVLVELQTQDFEDGTDFRVFEIARKILDLEASEATRLFVPSVGVTLDYITVDQAVTVLKHAADTGVIDWRVAGFDLKG